MSIDDEWIARIKQTMAADLSRGVSGGVKADGLVRMLFDIPEVDQAFRLRADRRRSLTLDPTSPAERQEIAEALGRVADWLDDGFHEGTVEELRAIAAELGAPGS